MHLQLFCSLYFSCSLEYTRLGCLAPLWPLGAEPRNEVYILTQIGIGDGSFGWRICLHHDIVPQGRLPTTLEAF